MEVFTFSPSERHPLQGNSFVMKMTILSDSPSDYLKFFSTFNYYNCSTKGIKDYLRSYGGNDGGKWFLIHYSDDFCIKMSSREPFLMTISKISPHIYQRMGIVGRKIGNEWEVVIKQNDDSKISTLLRNMDGEYLAGPLPFHYVGDCEKFPFMEGKTRINAEIHDLPHLENIDEEEETDILDFNEWMGFLHLNCNIISSSTIDPFITTFRPCKEEKYNMCKMIKVNSPYFLADWIIEFFTKENISSIKCMCASAPTNSYAFSLRNSYQLSVFRNRNQ